MDQLATDLFRTRDHVADFDRYVALYATRSAESRARHACRLDVAYGTGPAERLDLFFPPAMISPRPIHLFIHGGYWRMFSKDDFSFIADTVTASGAIAAVMDYALMPAVRMETIVGQIRRAASWLAQNAAALGGDPTRLTISGHSAGAHLCCTLLEQGAPVFTQGALLLSGIYDLAPLQSSFLQPLIGLTDDEVADFSPTHAPFKPGRNLFLLVGEQETEPFHAQSGQLQTILQGFGAEAEHRTLAGRNHMSAVLDLGDIDGEAGTILQGLCQL